MDTGRDADKFILRMPPGLRDKVKVVAAVNRRSMNSEIVTLIEKSLSAVDVRLSNSGQTP